METTAQQFNAKTQQTARNVQDSVSRVSDVVTDAASQAYDTARKSGEEVVHQLQDRGAEYAKSMESAIKSDPLRSALICAGVGFIVGRLMSRP